ncbi:hypothetical protein D3C71_1772510 [compost metagenome]
MLFQSCRGMFGFREAAPRGVVRSGGGKEPFPGLMVQYTSLPPTSGGVGSDGYGGYVAVGCGGS